MSEFATETEAAHVEAGAEPGDVEAASAASASTEATPSAESAAPTWTPPEPEGPSAREEMLAALNEFVGELPGEQQGIPELDPFADNFAEQLAARDDALINKVIEAIRPEIDPLKTYAQQQQAERNQQVVSDILDRFTDLGDFDRDAAIAVATQTVGQFSNYGSRADEMALRAAAEKQAGIEKAAEERGIARFKAQLENVSGAEGGAAAATGTGVQAAPKYKNELEAALAVFERGHLGQS